MTLQARLVKDHDNLAPYTPNADVAPGTILQLPDDGRTAVVAGVQGIKAGQTGNVLTHGIFKVPTASATTFADGDLVGWDVSAGLAVAAANAASDYTIGKARLGGSADGETFVHVAINADRYDYVAA